MAVYQDGQRDTTGGSQAPTPTQYNCMLETKKHSPPSV